MSLDRLFGFAYGVIVGMSACRLWLDKDIIHFLPIGIALFGFLMLGGHHGQTNPDKTER